MFGKLIKKVTEAPKKAIKATTDLTKKVSKEVGAKTKAAGQGIKNLNPFKK